MMFTHTRLLAGAAAVALLASGVTACGSGADGAGGDQKADCSQIDLSKAPDKPVKLRMAHGTAAEEPVYLMQADTGTTPYRGTWYEPEYTTITKSSDRMTSIISRQIDGAVMSIPPLVNAKAKGVDFSIVASVSKEAEGSFLSTFVATKDSGITKVEDLKGKTIGIADYGTSHDYWAQKAVASAGLDPKKDVKYAVVPLATMEESLRNGTVDAVGLVEPFYSIAQKKGGLVDVFNSLTGSDVDQELQEAIFGNAYIEENPGAVCAWIADYKKTVNAYNKDVKGSKQSILDAKIVQAPADVYLAASDWERPKDGTVKLEELDELIASMKKFGLVESGADVTAKDLVHPGVSNVE